MSENNPTNYGPNRPHIRISGDRIDRDRKKSGKPPFGEKKDNEEMGKILSEQLQRAIQYGRRESRIGDKESIFFSVQTTGPIEQEDAILHRLHMRFSLQLDEYAAVVCVDQHGIVNLLSDLKEYETTNNLRSYFGRIERISILKITKIRNELIDWFNSQSKENIEIQLFPNLGIETYYKIIRALTDYIRQKGERVLDSRIDEHLASLRAFIEPDTARIVLQAVDAVWQVRQAPEILIEEPQSFESNELPSSRLPVADAKTVCVLDAGLVDTHPFLQHIVLKTVDLTDDGNLDDQNGHGTFVSGLAAYGDFEYQYEPEATANIIFAKVRGKANNNYPYLEKRIERAVDLFHDYAKIYTLSVMYPQCTSTDYPSDLAFTIDELSNKYGVLFTVCSGNVTDSLISASYPNYLLDANCRIFCGAEASTAVTVGGIANRDSRTLAKRGQPSPFTRRGEIGLRGKPDVVFNAGNQEIDGNGRTSSNRDLAVVSIGTENRALAYGIGTSYSTPSVANILARLQREYPDASPNLLKALLIHFANWPDGSHSLIASDSLKRALYGKGLPEFEKCAYSQSYAPAYIVEDSVRFDEVAFVPIQVPFNMSTINYEKRMRVTLVYNPPVDMGVKGYTLVDLDFTLFKPIRNKKTRKLEYKVQRKWMDDNRTAWDNVKTDVFRWQREGWGLEWSLMITPRVRFRKRLQDFSETQDYALVITLEDPSKRLNIYDSIIKERRRITKPLEAYIQSAPMSM